MIYIYRALWVLFYIPVLILKLVIFIIGILIFIIANFIWYVKTGNVENTPDIFIPGKLYISYRLFLKTYKNNENYDSNF